MYIVNNASERARWQVLWVKDGRIVQKRFGDDFKEATDLYLKAKLAGRSLVTLRCCNMGFPPPEKYRDHEVVIKGKRYLKRPLKLLNAKGIFWCPYCRELRRFKKTNHFVLDGIRVQEVRHVCPMCGISHRDPHVRRWNPIATRLFYELEEAPRRRASRTKESRKKEFKRKRRRKAR